MVEGRLPACRYTRLACERHLRDLETAHARGLWWDAEAVIDVELFYSALPHSKGEWAGQRIQLEGWQMFILGSLFGWKRLDGTRRFRSAYVEVPRKNGKSTTAAGLGLYLAFEDGEPGAEVYAAATKRDQAKIVWTEARRMVLRTAKLRERITVLTGNLNDHTTASKFEPLGADADNLDGLNVHAYINDELHAQKTRAMQDVLETAVGARRQPLGFSITTAGSNRAGVCYDTRTYLVKVLEQVFDDDGTFGVIYTIDDGDKWDDEACWCLASDTKLYARLRRGPTVMTIQGLMRDPHPEHIELWDGREWVRVLGGSKATERGQTVRLELRSGQRISCTAHHEWPTQRGKVRADQLRRGDVVATTTLPEPEESPALIPPDVGWFIGLYLAEGSHSKSQGGTSTTIQFSGHALENVERLKRLADLARSYAGACHAHTYGNRGTVNVECAVLEAILQVYVGGVTAKDKYLRPAAWRQSNAFLRQLAQGYLDGDGHYDAKNDRFRLGFCRNDRLADSLRTLAARLGARVRLRTGFAKYQLGRRPIWKGEWRWVVRAHHSSNASGEIVGLRRSGARDFWHIGVASTDGLFALASGVLTHNSKANPNLNVSVKLDDMRAQAKKAKETPAARSAFLTKRLNVWVNADAPFFDMTLWTHAAKPFDLAEVAKVPCWLGIDLASKSDLAAVIAVFVGEGRVRVRTRFYLPRELVLAGAHAETAHYAGWAESGYLTLTEGNLIDFGVIREDIKALATQVDIREIGYDPYQATQIVTELSAAGLTLVEIPQTVKSLSGPMKAIRDLLRDDKLEHDGNPVMAWCISNVVAHEDLNENVFPRKASRNLKIDGATALFTAYARPAIQPETTSIYEQRGLAQVGA